MCIRDRDIIYTIGIFLHFIALPGILVYGTVYIPNKFRINDPKELWKIRVDHLIYYFLLTIWLISFGVYALLILELNAAAVLSFSGPFLIPIGYLFLNVIPKIEKENGQRGNKSILNKLKFYAFFALVLIAAVIVIAIIERDIENTFIESSFILIYLSILFSGFKFVREYRKNKIRRKEEVFMNGYDIFPTFALKVPKNKEEQAELNDFELREDNTETYWFLLTAAQFITWSLIAILVLQKEHRYVGFGLGSLGFLAGYVYFQKRNFEGNSFHKNDLLITEEYHKEILEQFWRLRVQM